ncbi:MAG: UDP-2,3-diacylglucosamine diphosphatase [Leptothrix ochracea]|uniref:UDP-2,3-diacylglucosamine diphosphatase n=1 Tax=Leptothrix ochracea TaxID=735331 RepID=UPI0034E1C68B
MITHLDAPTAWQRIDLISDVHLCDATPASLEVLLQHLRHTPAQAVLLLGDMFEAWIGDDAAFLKDAPEHALMQALAEASQGRWVGFLHGNRDFLVGSHLLGALGWHALDDPCVLSTAWGERFLLSHGDQLCTQDSDYQRFRAMVRSPDWQQAFLARPLTERREIARAMRQASMANHQDAHHTVDPTDDGVDLVAALALLHTHDCPVLIHGHTHRPQTQALGASHGRHVLSDWDLDHPPLRSEVLCLTAQGWQRQKPSRPSFQNP